VLSGRGFCVGRITRPEESYGVWCVQWVWSRTPKSGRSATKKKKICTTQFQYRC